MTSRWRQREATTASTWRQSLLFNSLLLLFPIFAAHIITSAYTSDIATDPMGVEARTETRDRIDETLSILIPAGADQRAEWASRIETTLAERDFSSARGYLLAAPLMLDNRDAKAVLAAADAERSGTQDQRLARAALLFLPDNVRAAYQRAISPPQLEDMPPLPEAGVTSADSADTGSEDTTTDAGTATSDEPGAPPAPDPLKARLTLSLVGDPVDLTRRSQRWLIGDDADTVTLRLRALGLIMAEDERAGSAAFAEAASILSAAHRAGRLKDRFEGYIVSRIEDALPEQALRESLETVFDEVRATEERAGDVVSAYRETIEQDALDRLSRDMAIIARLAELTSSAGAVTLVEQASTPDDMRRAQLLAEAGGERSVALARELGRDVLRLAQIGAKWTWGLAVQVMFLTALGVALLWTAVSALSQADSLRLKLRYS